MKKQILFFCCFFLGLQLFQIVFFLVLSDETCFVFQKVFYIIDNLAILLASKRVCKSYINALSLFLFFVFFFNGSRIVLDLFGYDDMRELTFFSDETISTYNTNRSILNINIGILSVAIGYLYLFVRYAKPLNDIAPIQKKIPDIVILPLLLIGLFAKFYIAYESFSFLMLMSYSDYYADVQGIPAYLRIPSYLPIIICLYKLRTNGKWYWICILFIYALLSMATGQRGPGMLLIVVTLYYCYRLKIIKFSFSKLFFLILLSFALMMTIGLVRQGDKVKDDDLESTPIDFLWGNGASISVLQIAIQDYEKLDYHFKNIFGNIENMIDYYLPTGNINRKDGLTIYAKKYKMWSNYISYYVDSRLYYIGAGLGGNYFGQAYAVGKEYFVFIVSVLVGLFLLYLDKNLLSGNAIKSYLIFTIFLSFIYIPRDNLMDFFTDSLDPALASLFVYFLQEMYYILVESGKKNTYYSRAMIIKKQY